MTSNGKKVEFNNNFMNNLMSQLDSSLTSNPKFVDTLVKEMNYIRYKTDSDDFSVDTAPDRKSVTIVSTNPVVDCAVHELNGLNKAFIMVKIYLNEDNLFDDYSQGVLFNRKSVEENGMRTSAHYETKFETSYFLSCYTKDGIEYSNNSFQDSYPLNKKDKEIDLRDQTLSSFHKPTFYEFSLPKAPIHILKGKARNTYRKKDDLAIIHTNVSTMTADGYKDISCTLYSVHPLFPDMLRGNALIAKSVEQDGKFVFVPEVNYATTIEEGCARAKKEFREGLPMEKETLNEQVYNSLINNI